MKTFSKYLQEQNGSMETDLRTSLSNTLATARDKPYQALGDGLEWAMKSAEMQHNDEGQALVRELQQMAASFFQRIRRFNINDGPSSGGRVPARMPTQGEHGFEEYQQEWEQFSDKFADRVRRSMKQSHV